MLQHIQTSLSIQRGENKFYPNYGMRFAEYFEAYRGSPWLERLLKIDVVRQVSIPYKDIVTKTQYTPLQCVNRVLGIKLLSKTVEDHKLPVRVDFDVQGIGRWQHDVSIYFPTTEQLDQRSTLTRV